jgi:hypothetical protein
MKITAKVVKLPDFKNLKTNRAMMTRAALAGGFVIEAYAKINANNVFSDKATNALANSINTEVTKASDTHAETVTGPTVIYGRIQELGGWIKPITAKVLHWVEDGIDIFAKAVYIPPRPYLRPAADEHEGDIKDAVTASLRADIGGD